MTIVLNNAKRNGMTTIETQLPNVSNDAAEKIRQKIQGLTSLVSVYEETILLDQQELKTAVSSLRVYKSIMKNAKTDLKLAKINYKQARRKVKQEQRGVSKEHREISKLIKQLVKLKKDILDANSELDLLSHQDKLNT
jgi:hypothetical protein